jgi:aryl-alcohol dehydrogenase-like predicted oxidoreductase
MLPRFTTKNMEANRPFVDAIAGLAARKRCTSAQVALAWLLAQGEDIVPIPGTKRLRYLEENAAATSVDLSAEELTGLNQAVSRLPVAGDRYTLEGMKGVGA